MKFREDINALRALAVSAVVLFHYKVHAVPGGFAGVDVFFVISGYLMTAIIMGRLAAGRFSLWEFYGDRARRIVPGLMGLCLGLLAAGYFLLEPSTYQSLGSSAVAALLFVSNFRFAEAAGYFDLQSEMKWLLHTWSLSVEWQFYLAYPLLLMGLYASPRTRGRIVPILWGLAAASFALGVWSSKASPQAAFYFLPQRAWELLAGGIVALQFAQGERKRPGALLACGFALIGASLLFFDKTMAWPSYWALLPVAGACLVIAANRAHARAFANGAVQTVGKWSYSIYLWHWPVAVGAVYFGFTRTTPLKVLSEIAVLAGILGAGALALAAWRRLPREAFLASRLRRAAAGGSLFALILGLAGLVTASDGLISRKPGILPELQAYAAAKSEWDYPGKCDGMGPDGNVRPCRLGAAADGTGVLVLGDSFAMQTYSRFAESAKLNPDVPVTYLASSACPPLIGIRMVNNRFNCNGFVEKALQFAEARHFERIILLSNWYGYFHPQDPWICFPEGGQCLIERDPEAYFRRVDHAFAQLQARLSGLQSRGAKIVIIGATPSGQLNVPIELAKRKFLGMDTKDMEYIDRAAYEAIAGPIKSRLIALASALGAKFIDPLDFLCDDGRCPTVDSAGMPYFKDDCHYRASAVKTARFQFLDDAAGLSSRVSATPQPGKIVLGDSNPRF